MMTVNANMTLIKKKHDTNCEHDTNNCASAVQITYFIIKTRFLMFLKNVKNMTLNANLTLIVQKT